MTLPSDPILLVSILNTYLRDKYDSFSSLCDDLDVSEEDIKNSLEKEGYIYNKELNQFKLK